LPAFGIYGRDVQDVEDMSIPEDVKGKLLLFGRAALAVMQMKGQSYLSVGSVSMGTTDPSSACEQPERQPDRQHPDAPYR
ncbi:MAG: hypothetical protein IIV28_06300, partial [Alistipes sp.]|nr:hypothetical protein [Alistipes sp.]